MSIVETLPNPKPSEAETEYATLLASPDLAETDVQEVVASMKIDFPNAMWVHQGAHGFDDEYFMEATRRLRARLV